jgi:hypothetical protein
LVRNRVVSGPGETPRGVLNSITGFFEVGTLQVKRLHRSAVIVMHPWGSPQEAVAGGCPSPQRDSDPLNLARYYQSLLDSGHFENRAALARYLGVSRARVTQVLRRLR